VNLIDSMRLIEFLFIIEFLRPKEVRPVGMIQCGSLNSYLLFNFCSPKNSIDGKVLEGWIKEFAAEICLIFVEPQLSKEKFLLYQCSFSMFYLFRLFLINSRLK